MYVLSEQGVEENTTQSLSAEITSLVEGLEETS
jgi:hypothetical protein